MLKVYFWIYLALIVLGLFSLIGYAPLTITDLISTILNIFILLAIYAYVFKKNLFARIYWQIIFWITSISFSLTLLEIYILPEGYLDKVFPFLKTSIPITGGAALFSILLSLPAVYCLYKLSYSSKNKK